MIVPDGTAAPEDVANSYVPTASPGGRPPHIWLDDGRSLFDLFGPEWTLLQLGGEVACAKPFISAAEKSGVELKVATLDSHEALELYESELVLIRPDQIVAWRDRGSRDDTAPRT